MLDSDAKVVASLTIPRRDAVAVILLNLYVLACALRADRPVPKYLPSAAAARRRLLDCMDVVEMERAGRRGGEGDGREGRRVEGDGGEGKRRQVDGEKGKGKDVNWEGKGKGEGEGRAQGVKGDEGGQGRRWADVYRYAFSSALTDVVENLQEMQRFTKEVCGEAEWDL